MSDEIERETEREQPSERERPRERHSEKEKKKDVYTRASAKSRALGVRPLPSKMAGPVTVIVI